MRRIFGIGLFVIGVMASVFGVVQGIDWLTDDPEAERQRMVEKLDKLFQKRLDALLRKLQARGQQTGGDAESLREDLLGAVETLRNASKKGREAVRRLIEDGKTDEAKALLARLAKGDVAVGAEARKRAARRYGQLGALAFLDDTKAAMDAYAKAAELDPHDPRSWNGLGTLQLRTGALDAAIDSFERVLRLGNAAGREDVTAGAIGNLGIIYRTRGELDRAEQMHKLALEINQKLGHKEAVSADFGNLGGIFYLRGELNRAERMHLKALQIDKKLDDKKGMAADYGNLGLIYLKRRMLDRAEAMFLKGLKIDKELSRQEGIANKTANLGLIYIARGNLNLAEEMFLRALKLAEELGSKAIQARASGNLGMIHASRGALHHAEAMFKQDLKLSEELGSKQGQARAAGNLGTLHHKIGDVARGCTYSALARDIFREIGMPNDVKKAEKFMHAADCPHV